MIKVLVGNNLDRNEVIVPETKTLRQVLNDNGVEYETGSMHLDGATLRPGDLDKTFADFGITTECRLINVVKATSAC